MNFPCSDRFWSENSNMKFTESNIRRLKTRPRKYEVADSLTDGLYVRVLPSGNRVFVARYRLDGKDTRERVGRVGEITLTEARARTTALVKGIEPRKQDRAKRIRFKTLVERYRDVHVRSLKPASQKNIRISLRDLADAFGSMFVDDIRADHVAEFHQKQASTPSAANARLQVLTHMYNMGKRWELVPSAYLVPTTGVRRYPEGRCERYLTPAERKRLKRVIDEAIATPGYRRGSLSWWYAGVIWFLSLSGWRKSEACDLTWDMIKWDHRCFDLPGTKTGRSVRPMSPQLGEFLREIERLHRKPGIDLVFYNRDGRRVGRSSLSYAWCRTRRRAGLDDVRLHDLRHSLASDARMAGVPLGVIGRLLGHNSERSTLRYAHIGNELVNEAATLVGDVIEHAASTGERKK